MARAAKSSAKKKKVATPKSKRSFAQRIADARAFVRRWVVRGALAALVLGMGWILLYTVVDPKKSRYMRAEERRIGAIDHSWVPMGEIAPVMARSVVAAEDANYCNHWGFDMSAIRAAVDAGGTRGASTLSQQVVKNVYLWHGRSYARKALEALMTPLVELTWSKRRILEVYLNVAEFDEGVFGVEAAAVHYFGVNAEDLTSVQAARLAAILPAPKSLFSGLNLRVLLGH